MQLRFYEAKAENRLGGWVSEKQIVSWDEGKQKVQAAIAKSRLKKQVTTGFAQPLMSAKMGLKKVTNKSRSKGLL